MTTRSRAPAGPLRKLLRAAGTALLVPVIFFEEWGWRPLSRLMARIGKLPLIRNLERAVANASPHQALALFVVPALALLPFKFGALFLIAHGHKMAGIAVILAAKVVSTALLGRLFVLTEPQLMSIGWFARAYNWWRATKDRVLQRVRQSATWRGTRILGRRIRRWVARA